MQPKVSMVMPCYNKVEYIGEMFDSILAQEWDNIELILVNDGSTDGTRDVIAQYEPRFRARGYEVVIVDQQNAGVCAAAKAGLTRITGEYVCMVDADDELDPKYVSTMAGWLYEHAEYDYCMCDAVNYSGVGENKKYYPFTPKTVPHEEQLLIERYLIENIRSTAWIYLVKTSYLRACRIPETYETSSKGSHEPGFVVPLLAKGGKYKYIACPFYRFHLVPGSHSGPRQFDKSIQYYKDYRHLCKIAIERLSESVMSNKRKLELIIIAEAAYYVRIIRYASGLLEDAEECRADAAKRLADILNSSPFVCESISYEEIQGKADFFMKSVLNAWDPDKAKAEPTPKGRIIGYGALGKAAGKLLPLLRGTNLEPSELWDIAGDGAEVKKPDFASLSDDDMLLVFPVGKVEAKLRQSLCRLTCKVLYNDEIKSILATELFGKHFCITFGEAN